MPVTFQEWPKTSRFFRTVVITEKIDGTNAAIGIKQVDVGEPADNRDPNVIEYVFRNGSLYAVYAQSRNKLITPGKSTDNHGFAGWVAEHAWDLVGFLGEGLHFGEWWGSGIQRGYGLQKGEKRFSLFNTQRFANINDDSLGLLHAVPELSTYTLSQYRIEDALERLQQFGSVAAPGFMNPEGICIYHTASRIVQKVTLDNNDSGKWQIN